MFFKEVTKYYNLNSDNKYRNKFAFVTIDIDWAPDSIVELVIDWFNKNNIPITVFYTHESELAKSLEYNSSIEIGIHPDFSRNNDANACVQNLMKIYPKAIGSRSHRNIDGRIVTDALAENNLKYHVNKLTWGLSHLEVIPMYNGLVEAPYFWEDGYHLELGVENRIDVLNIETIGLKIFSIHPMLFFLNCDNDDQRKHATYNIEDLTVTSIDQFSGKINKGEGIGTFTKKLILDLKNQGYKFLLLKEMMSPAYEHNSIRKRYNW